MKSNDLRQQVFNEGNSGAAAEVQLPLLRITSLHGIVIDLDPKVYRPGNTIFPPDDDPKGFYEKIKAILDRHPLARFAEVRMTGTGLHVIVQLDPPVELHSEAEQARWDAIVRAVQCTLPADPNAPGITALTRPVESANSKNGAVVEVLRPGQGVEPRAVEEFITRLAKAPFKEIATILLGDQHVAPCPACQTDGSRLDALDHVGMCYGACGKVNLAQLLDCVYAPLSPAGKAEKAPDKKKKEKKRAAPQRAKSGKGEKQAKTAERPQATKSAGKKRKTD